MRVNRRAAPDADLTSLIDVLFIMILFFVITASMMPGQVAVELPEGKGAPPRQQTVVITLQSDGALLYDGRPVSRQQAVTKAAGRPAGSGDLLVAADENLPYKLVAGLLEDLRAAGVRSVSLALRGSGS